MVSVCLLFTLSLGIYKCLNKTISLHNGERQKAVEQHNRFVYCERFPCEPAASAAATCVTIKCFQFIKTRRLDVFILFFFLLICFYKAVRFAWFIYTLHAFLRKIHIKISWNAVISYGFHNLLICNCLIVVTKQMALIEKEIIVGIRKSLFFLSFCSVMLQILTTFWQFLFKFDRARIDRHIEHERKFMMNLVFGPQ